MATATTIVSLETIGSPRGEISISYFPDTQGVYLSASEPADRRKAGVSVLLLMDRGNRGHPLAGPVSSEYNIAIGGTSHRFPILFSPLQRYEPHPFLHVSAANESRQTPIRIKRLAYLLPSPWRLDRPRRTLVPLRVQGVPQTCGCRLSGANSRVAHGAGDPLLLQPVTALRRPIQTRWLAFQSPILAHRRRRNLGKAALYVKRLALLQDVVTGPG